MTLVIEKAAAGPLTGMTCFVFELVASYSLHVLLIVGMCARALLPTKTSAR